MTLAASDEYVPSLAELKQLKKITLLKNPSIDENSLKITLALHIIRNALGSEWYLKYLHPDEDGPDIFRIFEPDPEEYAIKLIRLFHLADNIYCLSRIEGFIELLQKLPQRDFKGVEFELEVAKAFYNTNQLKSFVIPTGTKGQDYEYDINLCGIDVAVEVKTIEETASFESKNFRNTLNEKRAQLPKNKPGLIAVKIPISWKEHLSEGLSKVIRQFLENDTKRVNAVVLLLNDLLVCWPYRTLLGMIYPFINPTPIFTIPNIEEYFPDISKRITPENIMANSELNFWLEINSAV